ncbi:MAG: FtsX-like permease family protein [Hyphomicrobiaceae bacterium]
MKPLARHARTAAAATPAGRLGLAGTLRIAIRDLRGNLKRFVALALCIMLGVGAIAGVGTLRDSVDAGFDREGRAMLGGDLSVSRIHERAGADARAFLERRGAVSEVAMLRTMARGQAATGTAAQALVELKAVDDAYPLVGTLTLADGEDLAGALRPTPNAPHRAVVDPILLARLGLSVGDTIRLGEVEAVISGTIAREPDMLASQAAYGPRVMVTMATLAASGLAGPGSLVRWQVRLLLPDERGGGAEDLKTLAGAFEAAFPDGGYQLTDRRDPQPGLRRAIDRFGQFLTLTGLAALLIGGVGIANAVASYLDRKRRVIATFRALGATSGEIFHIYLTEILMLAGIGIGLGLAIGLAVPLLVGAIAGPALPIGLVYTVGPLSLAVAIAYGLLVALMFMLWPLGQAERVKAAVLFRDEIAAERGRPRLVHVAAIAVAAALLAGLAVLNSPQRMLALYFLAGIAALFAIFLALGWLIGLAARRIGRVRKPALHLALRNLSGPGGLTRAAVLSLGTGLSLMVALAVIDRSLIAEFEAGLPERAPAYYFLDIPKGEADGFEAEMRQTEPRAAVRMAPMLRGRIVRVKDRPVGELDVPESVRWVLSGDRGLTFADAPPEGAKLIEGSGWPRDHAGGPLVSFDVEVARGLGLAPGDTVTVNILGRNVTARVANLRTVDWEDLSINFVMIFSPDTLAAAPYRMLATLTFEGEPSAAEEGRLTQRLAERFPDVTILRVKDALAAVEAMFEKVMIAIRATSLVTVLAGAIVLAGALATAERRRTHQAVVLKVLGARRRQILDAHLAEYLMLAFATSAVAVAVGIIAAVLILKGAMDVPVAVPLAAVLGTVGLAVALVVGFGLAGTWRVLKARPMPHLKGDR